MDHADHYAAARNMMVDSQVRPNKVYDPRVLDAMRTLPRERFVPPASMARAYTDEDVPIGGGRFLTEPMVLARLVESARVRRGDRALVVAGGTGYAACVLAACGAEVTCLDQDEALLAMARDVVPALAPHVVIVAGPLADGWAAGAPYDVILIDGAAEDVPDAIVRQLRPASPDGGGRLVTARREAGSAGVAHGVLGEAVGGVLRMTTLFDCATPTLAAFRRAPGFVF